MVLKEDDLSSLPSPFWGGADIAGVVAEVGDGVDEFKPGDRVVANPSLFCGTCEYCIAGEESLCVNYGIIGDSVPGGFAEYIAVSTRNLLHLPESIPFEDNLFLQEYTVLV